MGDSSPMHKATAAEVKEMDEFELAVSRQIEQEARLGEVRERPAAKKQTPRTRSRPFKPRLSSPVCPFVLARALL